MASITGKLLTAQNLEDIMWIYSKWLRKGQTLFPATREGSQGWKLPAEEKEYATPEPPGEIQA